MSKRTMILTRPYKKVYREEGRIIKVFTLEHGKANVFNEALCQARVEESGFEIPKVLEVTQIDGEWAIVIEAVEGKTMEQIMAEDPDHLERHMEEFVDLQLAMHANHAPRLTLQKDKLARKINSLKDVLDATARYELCTRLDSMPNHTKLCHGDYNPSNVIVSPEGKMWIVDWAHATQGNASGDAAITFLQFALNDQKKADLYLDIFCRKSDTARQYVQKWMPIAAAAQLTKGVPEEKEFLMRWADIIDFQ